MKWTMMILVLMILTTTACVQITEQQSGSHMGDDVGDMMGDDAGGMMDDSDFDDMMGADAGDMMGDEEIFVLTGENYKFMMDGVEAPELRVKLGDRVRIEFTSTSGFHDWVLDEFGAATERVRDGESTSVEFVANKRGTFEYYCSVGQHRANGMRGVFIVE